MTIRRQFLQGLALAPLAMPAILSHRAYAQENQLLHIGYQKFNTLNILKGTGQLEQALEPLGWRVRWTEFLAGPQLIEALNVGAIDFGHAADTPSAFANAAGANAVYLGAEQPYPKGIAIFVTNDSDIQTVADLKGKKVVTGRGWNVQYLLVKALEEVGLTFSDIEPVYVSTAADVSATFLSKKVDAGTLWDPFLAGQEIATEPRILRDGSGLSNNRTFHLANPDFVQRNPETIRALFKALKQANDWTQAHPQETADQISLDLGVPAAVLKKATERRNYTTVAVTPDIIAEQQNIIDTFQALGLVRQQVKVADFVYPEVLV